MDGWMNALVHRAHTCYSKQYNIWYNVVRENRICLSYNMKALEDKYHFVLVCPAHRYIITTLLFMAKNIHKLLQSSSKSLTIKFCRYLNVKWKIFGHEL
jgi:hypothetical protein